MNYQTTVPNTADYFAKLKVDISPDTVELLRNFALDIEARGEYFNPINITDTPHPVKLGDSVRDQFTVYTVPPEIYEKTFINDLKKILNIKTIILRLPPQYYVNWHIDLSRSAGINIPLYQYDSYTCWSPDILNENDITKSVRLIKLNYELGSAHLINTSKYHCVANFSTEYRHIIVVFIYGKSYNDIRSDLITSGWM